jgi:hypothetical protein
MSRFNAVWREPLVHFLLIGAVLFLIFAIRQDESSTTPNSIRVEAGQVEQFIARFKRTWLRPPTDSELAGLIEGYIRDEVYYREALAMGLDRNDAVVRQRMRMKLEFMLEDLAAEQTASDESLNAYMQRHPDKFRQETHLSFNHVYLNPDNHQELAGDLQDVLARLQNGAPPETEGDRLLVSPAYEAVSQSEIERIFGKSFAQQLVELEPGGWSGPFYSGYGAHLVKVSSKQDGRFLTLEEIRAEVEREYLVERRQELKDATYQRLREGYEIVIDPIASQPTGTADTSNNQVTEQ